MSGISTTPAYLSPRLYLLIGNYGIIRCLRRQLRFGAKFGLFRLLNRYESEGQPTGETPEQDGATLFSLAFPLPITPTLRQFPSYKPRPERPDFFGLIDERLNILALVILIR